MLDASQIKKNNQSLLVKPKLEIKTLKNKLLQLDDLKESKFMIEKSIFSDKKKVLTGFEYLNGYWTRLPKKTKGLNGVFDFANQNNSISEMLEKNHDSKINSKFNSSSENNFFSMQTKKRNDKTLNQIKPNNGLQKELSTINLNLPFINKNQQITKAPISYYKMNRFFILNKKLDNLSALVFNPYDPIPVPSKHQKKSSYNDTISVEGSKIDPEKKLPPIDSTHTDSKIAIYEKKLSTIFR
jgi:hypothetical protein